MIIYGIIGSSIIGYSIAGYSYTIYGSISYDSASYSNVGYYTRTSNLKISSMNEYSIDQNLRYSYTSQWGHDI
jgi:hypothetical protein